MTILETERLRLREMADSDLDQMAALLGDPEVMRYYPAPKSRDEAQRWIDWNKRNYAEHGFGLWVVESIEGDFVGDCGLTWQTVDGTREVEVGYHVRRSAQGNGYATEAATACVQFARKRGIERLVAIINPANTASQRVAVKVGLKLEKRVTKNGLEQVVYAAII
jgi:RimJ/RimL family protein N-acetyltransferase